MSQMLETGDRATVPACGVNYENLITPHPAPVISCVAESKNI